jgi:hypothetical protein
MRLIIAGAVTLVLAAAPLASAGDSLSAHEEAAITILLYKRSPCADCKKAPNMRTATWRFASDFGGPKGDGVAYVSVPYKSFDGKRHSWLLGYDAFDGRWRIVAQSSDGSNRFSCDTKILINPNYRVDKQLELVKRVARCL